MEKVSNGSSSAYSRETTTQKPTASADVQVELKLGKGAPHEEPGRPASGGLTRAILRRHIKYLIISGIAKAIWGALVIFCAFYLVKTILDDPRDKWAGIFFALCVTLAEALRQMNVFASKYAILVRNDLWRELYTRAMWSSSDNPSEVLSLLLSDCQMVFDACTLFHYLWTGPAEAITICGLVASILHISAIPGIGLMALVLAIQFLSGMQISKKSDKREKYASQRLALLKEFVFYAKQVKLYAYERIFAQNLGVLRESEEAILLSAAHFKTISLAVVFVLPPAMAIVMFSTYALTTQPLKATVTFVTLSLFNTLRFPLVMIPKALKINIEGYKALKRIDAYLSVNPLPAAALEEMEAVVKSKPAGGEGPPGIQIVKASNGFLKDITLNIPKGTCIGIQGKVDSGKTFLLKSIITRGFTSGSFKVSGSVAYVPQVTWLQNRSVRDNICFGLPYDEKWYNEVVEACALTDDFLTMARGDLTSVGDKGMAVSGGQKQRISIARAVYRNADVYLLDNPLGALDPKTTQHVLVKCIRGLLKDKSVIFTSYNGKQLQLCDKVFGIENGRLSEPNPEDIAPPSRTVEHAPAPEIASALASIDVESHQETGHGHVTLRVANLSGRVSSLDGGARRSHEGPDHPAPVPFGRGLSRKDSRRMLTGALLRPESTKDIVVNEIVEEVASKEDNSTQQLAEGKEDNPPKVGIAWWLQRGGVATAVVVLFVHMAAQTIRILNDNWFRYWSKNKFNKSQRYYAWSQGCWVVSFLAALVIRGYAFYLYSLRASRKTHRRLVGSALFLPYQYFMQPNGIGQVLSTYSRCVVWGDDIFPDTIHLTLIYLLILATTTILASTVIKWIGIFTAGLFLAIPVALAVYLPISKGAKQEVDRVKTNIASMVTESVHGVTVIRAFGKSGTFVEDFIGNMTSLQAVEGLQLKHLYWLSFTLDNVGCLLMGAVAFLCVNKEIRKVYPRADVGLVISNALQAMVFYTWVVRGMGDTLFYAGALQDIPGAEVGKGETPDSQEDHNAHLTAPEWTQGSIEFRDVWLRYEPGSPLVLRGISLTITPGERVGIVGRSGCGKSSLIAALFLLNRPEKGQILVDGVDVCSIGLHQLRYSLCIIPQDPVLFSGTWRTNLDPFLRLSDEQLWASLELVGLKPLIPNLEEAITEDSLSMGQKQLICLCRVLVKRPKILVLDEATSNMDHDSEQVLVDLLKSSIMNGVTLLNIAHRIEILRGYDRVVRLANGNIESIAKPDDILGPAPPGVVTVPEHKGF